MIRKIQYYEESEYDQLILDATARGERLISVENISEGNFLTFTDDLEISEQLAELKKSQEIIRAAIDDLILNGGGF